VQLTGPSIDPGRLLRGVSILPPGIALLPAGVRPFQEWKPDQGNASAQFFRLESGYVLRFPGLADFRVSADGLVIDCAPAIDAGDRWQALYLQQVQPLLRSLTGDPVYHGAGIRIGDVAIAVLGPSGRGKSTLAAAFASRGHAFLGDDCLQVRLLPDSRAELLPQQRSIRLWEDSLSALATQGAVAVDVPGSRKRQLLATSGFEHCDQPTPLARVYLLGEPGAGEFKLSPLSAAQAAMAWTANAFVLDIKAPAVIRRNIRAAARLAQAAPACRLDYPRDYAALDVVVGGIIADLAASAL